MLFSMSPQINIIWPLCFSINFDWWPLSLQSYFLSQVYDSQKGLERLELHIYVLPLISP